MRVYCCNLRFLTRRGNYKGLLRTRLFCYQWTCECQMVHTSHQSVSRFSNRVVLVLASVSIVAFVFCVCGDGRAANS